jgi:hypothetical protein
MANDDPSAQRFRDEGHEPFLRVCIDSPSNDPRPEVAWEEENESLERLCEEWPALREIRSGRMGRDAVHNQICRIYKQAISEQDGALDHLVSRLHAQFSREQQILENKPTAGDEFKMCWSRLKMTLDKTVRAREDGQNAQFLECNPAGAIYSLIREQLTDLQRKPSALLKVPQEVQRFADAMQSFGGVPGEFNGNTVHRISYFVEKLFNTYVQPAMVKFNKCVDEQLKLTLNMALNIEQEKGLPATARKLMHGHAMVSINALVARIRVRLQDLFTVRLKVRRLSVECEWGGCFQLHTM